MKDTAHSVALFTSARELRANLATKGGKGSHMALVSHQFDARVTGHSSLLSFSRAAIGDEYRILSQKTKLLKKSPSDNLSSLSYLAHIVELMIIGGVKDGRDAAARLEETQAAEVTIALEQPAISEKNTSA
jgi:hypothetical protein